MASKVGISFKKDVTGCYRVAWRGGVEGAEAFYVASFDEAVAVARRLERDWDATRREVTRDLIGS